MRVHELQLRWADALGGRGDRWLRRVRRFPNATFLLLLPLLVALTLTVLRVGLAAVMSPPAALGFYLVVTYPAWWATECLTRLAHRALRRGQPPLWLPCILGSIGQALALSPFYRWVFQAAEPFLLDGTRMADKPMPAWTLHYVMVLLAELAPGALVWVAANYAWRALLGHSRFATTPIAAHGAAAPRAAPAAAASAPVVATTPSAQVSGRTPPAFLSRSRLPAEAEVLAITAEEHYVRVVTDRGADLVRYRFSEALGELADEPRGMQVHRSWWVRLDAVTHSTTKGRSLVLTLRDGQAVPVSLAFREAVLRALSTVNAPAGRAPS